MTTPLMIKIGLHYWATPGDYSPDNQENRNSPAVRECIDFMFRHGMLRLSDERDEDRDPAKYRATDALKAWVVDGLCKVPFPEQVWIIPWNHEGETS